MKEQKLNAKHNKGITLIALIITIVVLLILAVVSIGAIKDSSIITHAQESATGWKKAQDNEKDILQEYEDELSGNSELKVTFTEENVPVPIGFEVVEGTTKDMGLVIKNKTEGSEFVWIPVTKNIVAYGLGTTDFREPDVLDVDSTQKYLELAGCTVDLNGDEKIDKEDFKKQLEKEFFEMAESIKKYSGFYVGRYEVSVNNSGKAQSKGSTDDVSIVPANGGTESANTWWGLYSLCKTYSTETVQSSMIWGSEYDLIMSWIGDDADTTIGEKRNTTGYTGATETDIINNIYDLYGNFIEWTLEVSNDNKRTARGGTGLLSSGNLAPNNRESYPPAGDHPYDFSAVYTSRLALYIK